jgi:hypothetical protein
VCIDAITVLKFKVEGDHVVSKSRKGEIWHGYLTEYNHRSTTGDERLTQKSACKRKSPQDHAAMAE